MNNENRKIIGYDPNTGQPIYETQNIQNQQYVNQLNNQTNNVQMNNGQLTNNIVDNNQTNKIKKERSNLVKTLIITNILTIILLIIFIVAFICKGNNANNMNNTSNANEQKEDNSYTSTATDKPVSKDWKEYQFSIKGKTLTLPCSYKEFKDISGFAMKSSDEKSYIERNSSISVNLYIGNLESQKLALYTDIKNNTSNDLVYSDSKIVSLWQTKYQVETNGAEAITFPGNLKVGMEITQEEIVNLFGEPTDIHDYSDDKYNSVTLTYNGDETYTTINYYKIELQNNKIVGITLDHKKY